MSSGTDEIWDNEDAMEFKGVQVSLTCVKCRQTGERVVQYCGPTQRAWNYEDVPTPATANRIRFGRFIWRAKEKNSDTKQCQLDGEHFHLHCQYCQFKWTEPLTPTTPPSEEAELPEWLKENRTELEKLDRRPPSVGDPTMG